MSITVSIQVRLNSVDPGVAFVGGHGFVVAVPLFLYDRHVTGPG